MSRMPFTGPMPPPVHGQAVATQTVANHIQAHGVSLEIVDTGNGAAAPKVIVLGRRVWAHLTAIWLCCFSKSKTAYISVGANKGMYITALMALFARFSGKRVVLHHHTYAHIAKKALRMTALANFAGPNSVHVTVCRAMSSDLRSLYPQVRHTIEYSNIGSVDVNLLNVPREPRRPKTLGFMSNLTLEKGTDLAIEAFRVAKSRGLVDRLVLAGPCNDLGAQLAINLANREFANDLEYLGPVYDAEKVLFFSDIDVFLFPSLYNNETQGIVNLEALAAGLPIIAFGLCCIPSDFSTASCRVVSPRGDFVEETSSFLEELHAGLFSSTSTMSREQFRALLAAHDAEKARLLEAVSD